MVSPTIDHSRMESDPSSTSEEGQTSLKGILKCRKSSFSIPADEGGTRTGRKIKFNDVAVLFSAAVEGEFQLFVDTCRKVSRVARTCSSVDVFLWMCSSVDVFLWMCSSVDVFLCGCVPLWMCSFGCVPLWTCSFSVYYPVFVSISILFLIYILFN